MPSNSDPYSFESLFALDAAALRELVDVATRVLKHKHVALGEKREREDGGDGDGESVDGKRIKASTEELNKAMEMRASEVAGDYALPFGKHRGVPIRRVDMSYLTWVMGYKRRGQTFERQPESVSMDWIQENQSVALGEIRKYLTWRCWVCRSTDVRFPSARLCRSCYLSGKGMCVAD